MARRCSICQHETRDAIDSSLIHGEPLRSIAGRHGLSATALHRHHKAHLPKALARAQEAEEIVRGESLLEEVEALMARTDIICEQSMANGDMRLALSAIREKRGCLELLGKVTGEIDGPEHPADPRPMFALPNGSYPRITVEIPDEDVRELPPGDCPPPPPHPPPPK